MIKKIQVLLIDDYPSFALTKVANASSFKEVSLSDSQKEKPIPSIEEFQTEKREISSTKVLKPSAVTLETEKIEFSKYFELKWLRNADDIQLFRKLCQDIEEEHSPSRLGEDDGFVPEVVLFDYALTGHEDMNYPNESDDMEILQRSVPIYNLKKILTDKDGESKTHTIEPFDLSVFEIESGLNSDNIGCIGGVLTVSYFRNHPCIGIATTRKSDEHLKGQEAKFVEGLVKEPHQFDFSLRGNNNNLNWETLLKRSASNLRERIKILIQSSKITPSLSQLIELAGGTITDRVFTFTSIYGERVLPLDGLFIDVEEANRNESIKNFAKKCLDLHLKNANEGLTKDVLEAAIKFCVDLLEQYDNKEGKFLERIRFSQLKQKADNSTITTEQQTELDGIYTKLGMDKDAKEYKDAFDLRHYNGANDNLVKRYAALFVMVNIYNRYLEFKESNADKTEFKGKPYLFTQPEKMDYLLAIYPRPATPLVMPLHGASDGLDNDLKRTTKRANTDTAGILINSVLNKKDGISDGEKFLLQSYANGIGMKKENFAEWFI